MPNRKSRITFGRLHASAMKSLSRKLHHSLKQKFKLGNNKRHLNNRTKVVGKIKLLPDKSLVIVMAMVQLRILRETKAQTRTKKAKKIIKIRNKTKIFRTILLSMIEAMAKVAAPLPQDISSRHKKRNNKDTRECNRVTMEEVLTTICKLVQSVDKEIRVDLLSPLASSIRMTIMEVVMDNIITKVLQI